MTVFYSPAQSPSDFAGTPVLTPLLADLGSFGEVALRWALPSVLVLAGLLACLRPIGSMGVPQRSELLDMV
ncbi:hypothetical protein AB0J42_18990 [Nonomuraea sp. NPDC049649]|uniref:hypothetical protein n=1 Tax=Nonomuraea sp. NPDC049649 TaxID=3155776 RepID=UPI00342559CE